METRELKEKIKRLYKEIKHHIESMYLHDDAINICGQIWYNELTVSEQVDMMISVKPSQIKKNLPYTCINMMACMVEQ